MPPHLPSHQCHEVEVCRRKVSKAEVTMVPFFDNRADNLKGSCTRSPCECWHPPKCQFYKTETGCKAGNKCLFPHHEVDEQRDKKPKKSDHSQKRRESDDKNAVSRKTQSYWILKEATTPGETRFEGYDSFSLRYVKQVSAKRKNHRWEKLSVKVTHQRCARSKAWNLAKHIYRMWHDQCKFGLNTSISDLSRFVGW